MPQDKKKSTSYRSFVTCSDPKGVVECGAIRKYKISPQKKEQQHNKIITVEKQKEKLSTEDTSLAVNREDRKEMGLGRITRQLESTTSASFQLLEVSKGADKLNHVINSWSNKGEGHQKDVTLGLLRGALDLQESLIRLGRLQEEASSIMSQSRRKQKQKLQEGTFDGMLSGANVMDAKQFGYVQDEKLDLGFQRPRKSFDEVKKVVRESLLRQNVINNPIFEEHYNYRKLGSPDMPSTSSSHSSSMVHSSNFVPSESSTSSTASQRKRRKDLNLVVKLMGLESPPASPRRYREENKVLNLSKPMYEIDSPRARIPHFCAPEFGKSQRTVEEILESLNFKGLLRSDSVNGRIQSSPKSEVFSSSNRTTYERPPIVIMKPSRFPCQDQEESIMPRFREGRVTEPSYSKRFVDEAVRKQAARFSEQYEVTGSRYEEHSKFVKQGVFARPKPPGNLDQEKLKKQAALRKENEIGKVTPSRRKAEKKDPKLSDEMRSRDQEKFISPKTRKQKDGRLISKHHTLSQPDVTSTSILDRIRKETSKISGQQETNRLIEENKISKDEEKKRKAAYKKEIASASENDSDLPATDSMIVNDIHEQKWPEACQIEITDYDVDDQSSYSEIQEGIEHLQNDKRLTICDTATSVVYEDCSGHRPHEINSDFSRLTLVPTDKDCSVGQIGKNRHPVCDITVVTTHENGHAGHLDETSLSIEYEKGMASTKETDNKASRQCLTPRTTIKALLLSNSSFVNHLDELFDLQVHPDIIPCVHHDSVPDEECSRVFIDYANEFLRLRSSQSLLSYLPQTQICTKSAQNPLSLDRLLEDICNDMENLRCYHRPAADDTFSSDNVYVMLTRDLSSKSGIWELGWRRMFSQDDVEQVINEVDRHIIGKLIEEVLLDFMT